jgi:glycolate oxidase FAD binding subunit
VTAFVTWPILWAYSGAPLCKEQGWAGCAWASSAAILGLYSLRPELEQMGGSLAVLHRPAAMPAIDAWGSGGDAFPLMLRVKQQFDPRGTLNPGRFIGGI